MWGRGGICSVIRNESLRIGDSVAARSYEGKSTAPQAWIPGAVLVVSPLWSAQALDPWLRGALGQPKLHTKRHAEVKSCMAIGLEHQIVSDGISMFPVLLQRAFRVKCMCMWRTAGGVGPWRSAFGTSLF